MKRVKTKKNVKTINYLLILLDYPKEDEFITIENDKNLVKEINISQFKHLKEHEKRKCIFLT